MRKKEATPIGTLIQEVMRKQGLETPLNQFRLIQSWEEVMGHGISQYTGNMFIKNQVLHVELKSPVLKSELGMSHRQIAQRLNAQIKANVITDVRFY